jgi:hypothetical protein
MQRGVELVANAHGNDLNQDRQDLKDSLNDLNFDSLDLRDHLDDPNYNRLDP